MSLGTDHRLQRRRRWYQAGFFALFVLAPLLDLFRLDLTLGGVTYHLKEEDTFYFSSTQNHRFENPGKEDTVVVWVNHPASW